MNTDKSTTIEPIKTYEQYNRLMAKWLESVNKYHRKKFQRERESSNSNKDTDSRHQKSKEKHDVRPT